MKIDFSKLFLRANTHRVANVGLGGLVTAGAVHIAAAIAGRHDAQGVVPVALSALDSITLPFAMGSGAVAYLGRPSTIAAVPSAEAMDAIAKSPVATAEVEAIAEAAKPSDAIPKGSQLITGRSDSPPAPSARSGGAIAPASLVGADVPRPSPHAHAAAMLAHVLPALAGGRALTMTLFQDLQIGEQILGDLAAFASGKPVTQSGRFGSMNYTAEVQALPNGPSGTPFQVLEGGPLALMSIAFGDVAAFSAGQPIKIAEKIGNTWYGTSFSAAAAVSTSAPA